MTSSPSSRSERGFTRPAAGRVIGGVCAGVAGSLRVDLSLVRLVALVLALAWGIGVPLYFALWVFMPSAQEEGARSFRKRLHLMGVDLRASSGRFRDRWMSEGGAPWPFPISRRTSALAAGLLGVVLLLGSVGAFDWLTVTRAVGVVCVALGLIVFSTHREDRSRGEDWSAAGNGDDGT